MCYQSLGFAACGAITNGFIDCAPTKISIAYVNSSGVALIQTSDANGAPNGGWLQINGTDGLAVPTSKIMYATALTAVSTQQKCWVRIKPTLSQIGFWTVDILAIQP